MSLGTAWCVTDRLVLTAFHCIADRQDGKHKFSDFEVWFPKEDTKHPTVPVGKRDDSDVIGVKGVIASHPNLDVALLELEEVRKHVIPLRKVGNLATKPVFGGDRLLFDAWGYTNAEPMGQVFSGTIIDTGASVEDQPAIALECPKVRWVQDNDSEMSMSLASGLSGAPVMVGGQAFGLIRWSPPNQDTVVYATALERLIGEGEFSLVLDELVATSGTGLVGRQCVIYAASVLILILIFAINLLSDWTEPLVPLEVERADSKLVVRGGSFRTAQGRAWTRGQEAPDVRADDLGVRLSRCVDSTSSTEADSTWADALREVSVLPKYGGMRLRPQLGLTPLGKNSASLYEFLVEKTGEPPLNEEVTDTTGVVLVLIPPGQASIGSCSDNRMVVQDLEAFFLSKYELTIGQWNQICGPGGVSSKGVLPMVNQSCDDLLNAVAHLDLQLPTEMQWEYACRAGSGHDMCCDDQFIRDCSVVGALAAPVGGRRANGFGLHDILGNVREWCRDQYGSYDSPAPRYPDGLIDRPAERSVASGTPSENPASQVRIEVTNSQRFPCRFLTLSFNQPVQIVEIETSRAEGPPVAGLQSSLVLSKVLEIRWNCPAAAVQPDEIVTVVVCPASVPGTAMLSQAGKPRWSNRSL